MATDFREKWGTDVDEAVRLALAELGLTIDEVEVTVLEEPSRGFFGIGSKLAKVRVEKKKPVEKPVEKPVKENRQEEKPKDKLKKEKVHKKEQKNETSKVSEPAEPLEDLKPIAEHPALDFIKQVTEEMGLELEAKAKAGEETLYINIEGKDSGTIIGKRGQTLDAIQYLTSLVVNKGKEGYTRVVVDAENYRAKREKTLEALSYRLANKVVKTKRSIKLEPMNPYERKVIHATLHNHAKVTTRSEGQDPYRRVIIELK